MRRFLKTPGHRLRDGTSVLRAALVVVALAAVAPGCASTPNVTSQADALVPGTTYSFSATVRGVNRLRDRTQEFTETVDGQLFVLPAGDLRVNSSHGTCPSASSRMKPFAARRVGSDYRIECGDLRLVLNDVRDGAPMGSVSVVIEQIRERRGRCNAYATDPANGVWVAPVGTIAAYVRAQRGR